MCSCPKRLCNISGDGGKTWTSQWLTIIDVLQHRAEGYIVEVSRLMK